MENEILMKFQTIKAHSFDVRHILPLPLSAHKPSISNSYGYLTTLFQRMFKHEKKDSPITNETPTIELVGDTSEKRNLGENEIEARSLQKLENCANAARQTEAASQYEWMDTTDE